MFHRSRHYTSNSVCVQKILILVFISLHIASLNGAAARADPSISKVSKKLDRNRNPRKVKPVDPRALLAEQRLKKEQPGKMECRFGKYSGLAEKMTGRWKIKGDDLKANAIDFVEKYCHLFGSPAGTLKPIESGQRPYVYNIQFQQTYKNLSVWGTAVHVGIERGAISWIQSPSLVNLLDFNIDVTPKVKAEQAVSVATIFMKENLPTWYQLDVVSGTASSTLGIYWNAYSDDIPTLGWSITFTGPRSRGASILVIDAITGEPLSYDTSRMF